MIHNISVVRFEKNYLNFMKLFLRVLLQLFSIRKIKNQISNGYLFVRTIYVERI